MEEQKDTKQNTYLVPVAIIAAGALIAGAVFFTRNYESPSREMAPGNPAAQEEIRPENVSIELDGWPSLGDQNAPVVMVEYSDFACPFCARFAQDTLPSIKRYFVDTGKVRFVYKDFVVVGGDRAAEAAHCAAEQGKFWEYHDLLFANYAQDRERWSDVQVHRGYAERLGMDANLLAECFTERRHQEKVERSTQEAAQNGGQGTPYFLINGRPISGAQPFSVFQSVINLALGDE
jgi:protein-disulfide isomerase